MIRNFHVSAINHRKTHTSCVEPTRRFYAGSTIMERIKKKKPARRYRIVRMIRRIYYARLTDVF